MTNQTSTQATTFQDTKACVWLFIILFLFCLCPLVPSWAALLLGFVIATVNLVPKKINLAPWTKSMLSWSIVGLGFGITVETAMNACEHGLGLVVGSIAITLILGVILGKILKLDTKLAYLVSSGTAICGGSAIAAVAPAIKAKDDQISLALATVFTLNAVALILFPLVGHLLQMTDLQFGLWCAVAIHDTSSVVGAGASYSDEALEIATTVKLARALFIVPIALLSTLFFSGSARKIRVPLFIVMYILAVLITSYIKFDFGFVSSTEIYNAIAIIAKRTIVGALFLIGSGITLSKLKKTGPRVLIQGIVLWIVIGSASLCYIMLNY